MRGGLVDTQQGQLLRLFAIVLVIFGPDKPFLFSLLVLLFHSLIHSFPYFEKEEERDYSHSPFSSRRLASAGGFGFLKENEQSVIKGCATCPCLGYKAASSSTHYA